MHFNKKNRIEDDLSITVKDNTIKLSNSVRFLGITFDTKLSFKEHFNSLQKRCLRSMNILKFISGTKWGTNADTLLILYKSLIRSIIDYGCFIYYPKLKIFQQRLEAIQNSAIRISLGLRNSTPNNVLLSESKLETIEQRARFLCQCYVAKSLSNINMSTHKTIVSAKKELSLKRKKFNKNSLLLSCLSTLDNDYDNVYNRENYNLYNYDFELIFLELKINTEVGSEIKSSTDPNALVNKIIEEHKAIPIYTDGSKSSTSESVGAASVCPQLNIFQTNSLPASCSIFTAESIALVNAVNIALKNPNHNYIIMSDSLSALTLLKRPHMDVKTSRFYYEIRRGVSNFRNRTKNDSDIYFFWIPAHIGIEGNELADINAKEASLYSPEIVYYTTRPVKKRMLKITGKYYAF